jgi:Flp pilus assembly protein TadG
MSSPTPRLSPKTKRFCNDDRGASAIEFAMIGAFLSIVLLNIVDIGLFYYRKMEITSAVRAGAQYALVNEDATDATVTTVVENATNLSGINVVVDTALCGCSDGTTFTCGSETCDSGTTTGRIQYYTSIDADYTHTWIFYPGTISITAAITIRTQ